MVHRIDLGIPRPTLVLVMGLPASGKTVLAERISGDTGLALLSKDSIKERLFDTLGSRDRDWSMTLGLATYRIMDYIVEAQLSVGNSLIVESTFNPKFDNSKVERWIDVYRARCIQVLCFADGEELIARFRRREQSDERHPGQDCLDDIPGFEDVLREGRAPMLDVESARLELDTTDFVIEREREVISKICELVNSSRPEGDSLFDDVSG